MTMRTTLKRIGLFDVVGLTVCLKTGPVLAVSIKFDLNTSWGAPSDAFGAASGQAGH